MTSVSVRVPALVIGALMASFASVILVTALVITGQYEDLTAASAATLLALVTSGVVGFAIGEPIYVRTLSILGMQRTYPVAMGLFILFSSTGGIVLLGERFTPGLVLGGVLIVGGAYLIAAFRREPSHGGHAAPSLPGDASSRTAVAPAAVQARSRHLRAYGMLVLVPVMWTTATLVLARTADEVGPIPAAALRVPAGAMLLTAFLLLVRPRDLGDALRSRRDVLTIAGETASEDRSEDSRLLIRERRSGKFSRSLRFPNVVNGEAIEANFDDGVLSITLPKAEHVKPRQIPVTVSGNAN